MKRLRLKGYEAPYFISYTLRDIEEEDSKEVEASKYDLNYIALTGALPFALTSTLPNELVAFAWSPGGPVPAALGPCLVMENGTDLLLLGLQAGPRVMAAGVGVATPVALLVGACRAHTVEHPAQGRVELVAKGRGRCRTGGGGVGRHRLGLPVQPARAARDLVGRNP